MSLLLMIIYWLAIPFLGFLLAQWLFRRARSPARKGLVIIGGLGILAWFLWLAVGEKVWLDKQVREMCAKDGGVKVYETVMLPPEKFDQYGNVHIPAKEKVKPEDKYYYEWDTHYYKKGDPSMWRDHIRIIQYDNRKVLGETVGYSRRGGDLPGPWHESSFRCPQVWNLEPLIFKQEEKMP